MKKKLLSAVLALGAMIASSAQNSLVFDSAIPSEVAPGEQIIINFTYELEIEDTVQIQIFETDDPGVFGGSVANGLDTEFPFPVLPATNGPTQGSVTINISSGRVPSSLLDAGNSYRIFGQLGNGVASASVNGAFPEITVTDPDFGLIYTDVNPIVTEQGGSVEISYLYSATEPVPIQFQVFSSTGANIFNGDEASLDGTFSQPTLPATDGFTEGSITISIPAASPSTEDLMAQNPDANYYLFGQLNVSPTQTINWAVNFEYPLMQIEDPTLSTTEFTNDLDEVFYNNSSNSLEIKANLSGKILDIYDLTGKKVQSTSNLNNTSLDVSNLPSGLYIAIIENQFLKFIK